MDTVYPRSGHVRCQMCGRTNAAEAEVCEFCGARIRPVLAATPVDSGEVPAGGGNERPAETPWPENPPSSTPAAPIPGVTGALPSRADKALSWLAGLRSQGPVEAAPEAEPEKSTGEQESQEPQESMDASDWLSRLGGEATPPEPPAEVPGETQGEQGEATLPAWLSDSLIQPPVETKAEAPVAAETAPVRPEPPEARAEEPVAEETAPVRMEQPDAKAEEPAAAEAASVWPEWLEEKRQEETVTGTPVQTGQVEEPAAEKPPEVEATQPAAGIGAPPDWLSNVRPGDGTLAALFGDEPQAEGGSAGAMPFQPLSEEGGVETPEGETEPAPGATPPAEEPGLPTWLADLGGIPPTGETPILADEGAPAGMEDKAPASLEMPDWLSKLQPEPEAEEAAPKKEESPAAPGEAGEVTEAELPAWVQAMRPVESVVGEPTPAREEAQFIEQTGPLAGLRGVLPAGPGLGPLRRPPTYLSKLEISEGQQRYAASLEQLVAEETKPHKVEAAKPTSKRLWRWLITLCLFLAIGMTLLGGAQVVPGTTLPYSDAGAASTLISGLSAGAPVLVAFDYDPALAGELDATAAPFLDELIGKGTPLALLSTSPTGPALAERFVQAARLRSGSQNQNVDRYVNLGYLAGGPAGMGYFADNPTGAMPATASGSPAWSTGPLQGVRRLEDFSAFIILTDNADTARNWIEQTSLRLGNVPLIMIISAQAEPIIRPYFESGQLKGLVSGLADAQLAEQASGGVGLASTYWSAYSIGILIAVLLIVFGAIGNALIGRQARRKNPGGEV